MNEHLQELKIGGRTKRKWEIELEKKDKEIERLKNKNEELLTLYTTEREVKEDYKSIIKEVRERMLNENKPLPSAREVLEILDKEEEQYNTYEEQQDYLWEQIDEDNIELGE